jgi:hypothetical protein
MCIQVYRWRRWSPRLAGQKDVTFDRFARLLSATPSRRVTLSLVSGTAFGAVAGLLGRDEAEARNKKKGSKKK